jgi:large subunit ribosomal protein L31
MEERMKKGIHPEYRPVVFRDGSADFAILTRSTIETERTIEWEDGNTYPLVELDISSASHPFYTGRQRIVDTGGRVQRFENKRQSRQKRQ